MRAALAALLLLGAFPGAALADQQAFRDVSPGNPFYGAVEDVAVTHRLMSGMPDSHTFNGNLPLRRIDFAMTLASFIKEIEVDTGISLSDNELSLYDFDDVSNPVQLAAVTKLANDYNLFSLIPDSMLSPQDFQPDRPVTRFEAAAMFDALMRLAQRKGLVTAVHESDPYNPSHNPFTDLSPLDWAYKPVLDVVRRYQIMAGTTDATFEGDRVLTRYEFAAVAARAFSLIRQEAAGIIVIHRPRRDAQAEVRYTEFHGEDPVMISAYGLLSLAGFKSAGAGGTLQWIGYTPLPWSSEARLINPSISAYHFGNLYQVAPSGYMDGNGNTLYQNNLLSESLAVASCKVGLVGGTPSPVQWELFLDPALLAGQVNAVSAASPITTPGGSTATTAMAAGAGAMLGGMLYDRTPEGALDITVEGGLAYLKPLQPGATPFLSGMVPMLRATIDSHLFLTQTSAIELPEIQVFMLPGEPAQPPSPYPMGPAQATSGTPGLTVGGGFGLSF